MLEAPEDRNTVSFCLWGSLCLYLERKIFLTHFWTISFGFITGSCFVSFKTILICVKRKGIISFPFHLNCVFLEMKNTICLEWEYYRMQPYWPQKMDLWLIEKMIRASLALHHEVSRERSCAICILQPSLWMCKGSKNPPMCVGLRCPCSSFPCQQHAHQQLISHGDRIEELQPPQLKSRCHRESVSLRKDPAATLTASPF